MIIEKLTNYHFDENTYIIYDEDTFNAIIIDPSLDYKQIIEKFSFINIKYILLTHCHFDHICGVKSILKNTQALLCCSKECKINLNNSVINVSKTLFSEEIVINECDKTFTDGEIFKMDSIEIKTIKTPGHTNGGICYLIENNLFSGDTLFFQSVGRWDLATGDYNILENSIKEKLYQLPDDIEVYPGHGKKTRIGYEKKYNMVIKPN